MVFCKNQLSNPFEYYCAEAIKQIHFIIQQQNI